MARRADITSALARVLDPDEPAFLTYLTASLVYLWRRREAVSDWLALGRVLSRDGVPYQLEVEPHTGEPGLFRAVRGTTRRDLFPPSASIGKRAQAVVVAFTLVPRLADADVPRAVQAALAAVQDMSPSKAPTRQEAVFDRALERVCSVMGLC